VLVGVQTVAAYALLARTPNQPASKIKNIVNASEKLFRFMIFSPLVE
jgi:hypothetical protein